MKKKIAALFIAGVMVFAMAGCGNSNKKTNEETTSASEEETTAETPKYEIGGESYAELTDYSEYISKLPEYKGLDFEVTKAEVTDEQLQEQIDAIIAEETTYEQITDRVVGENDTINLDYEGKLDGTAFDNGSATDYTYTIGGNFIPTLNDQLIGLECGKSYDLNCTFPDTYSNSDLAGKDVVFTVTVNYIQGSEIVPEWNDEFVNSYTDGEYTTTADYEASIKEDLLTSNLSSQKEEYVTAIWTNLLENAEFSSYPEEKLTEYTDDCYNYYQSQFQSAADTYGIDYDVMLSYYGLESDDDLKTQCEEIAKQELQQIMLVSVIAKNENITVTEDIYKSMAADYGYTDTEEFESQYGLDTIMESFVYNAVSEWLADNNNMVETDETTADTSEDTIDESSEETTEDTTAEAE